jgi:protein TonB
LKIVTTPPEKLQPKPSIFVPPPESPPIWITPSIGVPPHVIKRVPPDYPELARRSFLEGKVILEAVIDQTGKVRSLKILQVDHPILQLAAIRAAEQWLFSPGKIAGKPVIAYYTITIVFEMK